MEAPAFFLARNDAQELWGIFLRDFREFFGFYGQFMRILSMARELRNGIPMDL